MQLGTRLRILMCLAMIALIGIVCALFCQFSVKNEEIPHVENLVEYVRLLTHTIDYDERVEREIQQLIQMGDTVFPAYEAILTDPNSKPTEIAGVLLLLRRVKADRSCFRKYAVSCLTDTRDAVQLDALHLLEVIGSPAEASPVVAMLSDGDISLVYNAARTLAAIGGPNELVAMDLWLRGESHRDDRKTREHVKKFRDDLKKRLDAKKAPPK
jgi:HEAT repeat protein